MMPAPTTATRLVADRGEDEEGGKAVLLSKQTRERQDAWAVRRQRSGLFQAAP